MKKYTDTDLNKLIERVDALGGYLDLDERRATIEELNQQRLEPGFWDDPESAQQVEKQIAEEQKWIDEWEALKEKADDVETLRVLADEEDADLEAEIFAEAEALEKHLEKLELRSLLSDPDDKRDAILTINPGAGGTESQDWAEMLLRMYTRWGEQEGFEVKMLEYQPAEEAGIKSATLSIEGQYAYGYLKGESGVHRLVRISPYDSSNRRHTSFASVFVYPEVDDDIEVDLSAGETELQTFRSGGSGGQHVNKVATGVRLIWTGELSNGDEVRIEAECTAERSQLQNRNRAEQMLRSRVYQAEKELQEEAKEELESSKKKIEWGSQIRSYVLHPYTMANDHRTETKISDVEKVLDGYLEPFIQASLLHDVEAKKAPAP
ncbi:MAG: peptide chain release factor 2 [Bacteroidetes bacterium]|nr:peptide chain release factor 2 [Bacteroidota bacterium]